MTLLATALACAAACAAPKDQRVENVVLICLDTVRYDTLALVREVLQDDPAARWWSRGVWLTGAQSAAPWTVPSVASVFTGLYPNQHRAGAFANDRADLSTHFPLPLAQGFPTLAAELSKHDFDTVAFVASQSWFRSRLGLEQGFQSLETGLEHRAAVLARVRQWGAVRASDATAGRFLLYLHFMEAHRPPILGRRFLKRRIDAASPELIARALADAPPVCGEDPESLLCLRYQAYVAAVAELYRAVADVLESLDGEGLLESTAVALFADHGEEFEEHVQEERARTLGTKGRHGTGHGHSLYQEQLHVPLVFWHPALGEGDRDLAASLVDLVPTLFGWLGLEARWPLAGVDLGRALGGATADPERPLYASSVAFGAEREAVLRGDHKLISDGGTGAGALGFDLSRDAGERAPAPEAPGLGALLGSYREETARRARPTRPSAREIEALQALGYLRVVDDE